MKKVSMVAFAATALMAISCSDDDSSSNNSAALSGKWNLTKITADQPYDGNDDGVASTNLIAEGGSCFTSSYMEFGAGSSVANFISTPWIGNECFTYEDEGTFSASGNDVTVTATQDGENTVMEFTKSGNKLTTYVPDFYEVEVTVDGETQVVPVAATVEYTKE